LKRDGAGEVKKADTKFFFARKDSNKKKKQLMKERFRVQGQEDPGKGGGKSCRTTALLVDRGEKMVVLKGRTITRQRKKKAAASGGNPLMGNTRGGGAAEANSTSPFSRGDKRKKPGRGGKAAVRFQLYNLGGSKAKRIGGDRRSR